MKNIVGVLRKAYEGWKEDDVARLSAALSYYTIFSLVPLLVVTIAVVGLFFGRQAAEGQIVGQIENVVGRDTALFIQSTLQAANDKRAGLFAQLIGPITLVLGALGVFGHLKDSLNYIWGVEPPKGRGILGMVKDRFLSFAMVLGTGFLLLTSLVLSAGVQALGSYIESLAPGMPLLIQLLNFVVSFVLTTVLFAAIFRVLPDRHIRWDDVWLGAAVTSILFTIGKFAISMYLGTTGTASSFGAASSLVVLLVWVYYSSLILFSGAEITWAYSLFHHPEDARVANAVTREEKGRPVEKAAPASRPVPPRPAARQPASHRHPGSYGEKPGFGGYVLSFLTFGALFALSKLGKGRGRKAVHAH